MINSNKPDVEVQTEHAHRPFKLSLFIIILCIFMLTSLIPSQAVFANEGYTASLVADIDLGVGYYTTTHIRVVDCELYIMTKNGEDGNRLWRSNGTPQRTVRVENSAIAHQIENGTPYYVVDYDQGVELWKYNGTSPEPVMLKRIEGTYTSRVRGFTDLNGETYFTTNYSDVYVPSIRLSITGSGDVPLYFHNSTP